LKIHKHTDFGNTIIAEKENTKGILEMLFSLVLPVRWLGQ
jgi:hypothetical protein